MKTQYRLSWWQFVNGHWSYESKIISYKPPSVESFLIEAFPIIFPNNVWAADWFLEEA